MQLAHRIGIDELKNRILYVLRQLMWKNEGDGNGINTKHETFNTKRRTIQPFSSVKLNKPSKSQSPHII